MAIPLVDLKSQYQNIKPGIDDAIGHVLTRADFIQGEDVALLEREFADYCGVREAIGVASGTAALQLALLAGGVGPGDEVITTPFTFIATAEAIAQTGATPVFADIDPLTYNLDPARIEAAITPRTKAVIPVHLYGRPADMGPIRTIALKHRLLVFEDAAQAHGARYEGRRVGSLGDAGCFSFYPGKNLGGYGDGGMVVTDNPRVAERIRLLRDHGRQDKYEHLCLGFNGRLDTVQAAVLRVKLRYLDQWNRRRQSIAWMYSRALQRLHVTLPVADEGGIESVYHLFVIRTSARQAIQRSFAAKGIATGIHYPVPLHLQPALQHLGYRAGTFPVSERAANEVLSLPIYAEMTDDHVRQVISALTSALSAKSAVA